MPLQFAYNRSAGIEVVSVKAALAFKVPFASLNGPNPVQYGAWRVNLLQFQVSAGALEANPFDTGDPNTNDVSDDVFLVHTPFVDAGCFSQVGFNAYTASITSFNSPLFVRVIATMRRTGSAITDAPIYFVQDYAVEEFSGTAGYFSGLYRGSLDNPNPTTIISAGVSPVAISGYRATYDAAVNLLFTTNPVEFSYAAPAYGKAVLTAGGSIGITSELSVPANNELVMETSRVALLQCPPLLATPAGPFSCIPNLYALRSGAGTTTPPPPIRSAVLARGGMELAPNPATATTTAFLKGGADEYIERAEILNLQGQRLWVAAPQPLRYERQVTIPLAGLPVGLYVVRLVSNAHSYSQKLQIE